MKVDRLAEDITRIGGVGAGSVTADSEALAWALGAAPAHGRIGVRGGVTLQIDPATIPDITSPVTIEGVGGKPLLASQAAGTVFSVKSDHVTLRNMRSAGHDVGVATDRFVWLEGTAAAPLEHFQMDDVLTEGFWTSVQADHVDGFDLTGLKMNAPGYAGVMLVSARNGVVDRLQVKDLVQPPGFVNSYGIAMTRYELDNETLAPRSAHIAVSNSMVDGAPWEAYDTHGGEHLTFTNCHAENAVTGMALVPSNDTSNVTEILAPRHITVNSCSMSSGVDDGSAASGIVVRGSIGVGTNVTEYASNISLGGVSLDRFGTQDTDTIGALTMYGTKGLSFQGSIATPSAFGVMAYYGNQGFTIDGTVIDPWTTDGAICGAFIARSGTNHGAIRMSLARGDKTATRVAEYGAVIYSPGTTAITGKANDFSAATIAEVSGALLAGQA